jgi:hypothetical protein
MRGEKTNTWEKERPEMFRKFVLSLAAAFALATTLLLTPASALADHDGHERHERHDLRRVVWQYQGGFFKDAGNGRWVESNAGGTYYFREARRTGEFIDLYDASRGFTARLYGNAMYLQGGSDFPVFTKLYDGRWTE